MNRRQASAIVVIVAASAGLVGIVYASYTYEVFDDAMVHDTTADNEDRTHLESYSDEKPIARVHSTYPAYTFYEMVNMADAIVIGNITDKRSYDMADVVGNDTIGSVYTVFTVAVENTIKGTEIRELQYNRMGGETKKMIYISDGFMFDTGDQVLLFLKSKSYKGNAINVPLTLGAEYKIINNTQVAKYGESQTVPLDAFVSMIQEKLIRQ